MSAAGLPNVEAGGALLVDPLELGLATACVLARPCARAPTGSGLGSAVKPEYLARPPWNGVGVAVAAQWMPRPPRLRSAQMRKGDRLGSMSLVLPVGVGSPVDLRVDCGRISLPDSRDWGRSTLRRRSFAPSCARRWFATSIAVWAAALSAIRQAISSARTGQLTDCTIARCRRSGIIWLFLLPTSVGHHRTIDVD